MRFSPPAVALSLAFALAASVSHSAVPDVLSPRAGVLESAGRAALAAGQAEAATDDFEAALAIDPGSHLLVMDLAAAAQANGLQGKAIHYYRVLLTRDPDDVAALSGEGVAMAQKGALAKAQANLARLKELCGAECGATAQLAAVLGGPARAQTAMVSVEAVTPKPTVSAN